MTIQQTGAIMDILSVAYPMHYRNESDDKKFLASQLWAEMFVDDPAEYVIAAVKSFILTDTKGFPPSIGIIKDHLIRVTNPPQKTELEAWAEIKKALSKALVKYAGEAEDEATKSFNSFDPEIQRIIGSPSQLREWAAADTETLDSVIASNFQRSYRAIAKSQRDQKALPVEISGIVGNIAAKMDMKAIPADAG